MWALMVKCTSLRYLKRSFDVLFFKEKILLSSPPLSQIIFQLVNLNESMPFVLSRKTLSRLIVSASSFGLIASSEISRQTIIVVVNFVPELCSFVEWLTCVTRGKNFRCNYIANNDDVLEMTTRSFQLKSEFWDVSDVILKSRDGGELEKNHPNMLNA